jgi:putative addiction module component (TIGR02574 family)
MTTKEIIGAALALPETDRVELVEQLLESLGSDSDELDKKAFLAELQRRSAEIDAGTAELIPWSEIRDEPF